MAKLSVTASGNWTTVGSFDDRGNSALVTGATMASSVAETALTTAVMGEADAPSEASASALVVRRDVGIFLFFFLLAVATSNSYAPLIRVTKKTNK